MGRWRNYAIILPDGSLKTLQARAGSARCSNLYHSLLQQSLLRGSSVGAVHRFAHLKLTLTCLCTHVSVGTDCSRFGDKPFLEYQLRCAEICVNTPVLRSDYLWAFTRSTSSIIGCVCAPGPRLACNP